ncbi:MAG: TetR family transcriptional regulator [Gammaproteobacteria bacterium]|jgi:TetR/AcrR family transcriptional repressor of nem operon|nr:TetR family transcriptional regulator [Gammaproteobacteria bacterium]
MSPTSNTREQIIDKAFQLMLQRGLNGFSYRDISEPLGVKNAAIHYHFPNKMDLIKALIDENHLVLRRSTSEFMAYGGPARPQLEGLFAFTLNQCQCGRPICMVGALAIDYDDLTDEIKNANDRFMKDSVNWLTRVMEIGRDQEEFHFDGDAASKAVSILAMIQGARQLARVHGLDYLEKIFDQIRTDLGIKD